MEVLRRTMRPEDAEAVALLSEQLGYPTSGGRIRERYTAITRRPDNALFVAEVEGHVLGWIHVHGVHLLESPVPFAEIGGLVVHADARRRGIGRALMAEAEAWAVRCGYPDVRLRSNRHRTEAHEFYRSLGYDHVKTVFAFRKVLAS